MLFTCAPTCQHAYHQHKGKPKLFTSLTAKKLSGRTDGHLNVDVHCHYFNPEVAKKAASLNPGLQEYPYIYANQHTRDVNTKRSEEHMSELQSH